ncbi:divergent protein kinase domain 2A [Lampetra fluviatilis]
MVVRAFPLCKLGRLLRWLKLLLCLALLCLALARSHDFLSSLRHNVLTERRFLGLHRCPACFGTSWCRRFSAGQLTFRGAAQFRLLDRFNRQQVFAGRHTEPREGPRDVTLKRLGSPAQLAELDRALCLRATGRAACDVAKAVLRSEFNRLNGDPKAGVPPARLLTPAVVEGWSDLVHCPSQRLLDRVVRRYAETRDSGSFLLKNLKDSEKITLLLTIAFNPEPLVMQSFPPDEGWPLAKYLGACGRIVAESYVGPPLSDLLSSPWEKRVDLAWQALELAEQLSNNDLDFGLYLLDVRAESFGVGTRDGRLILTEASRVLVSDKRHIRQERPAQFDSPYETAHQDCRDSDCLALSPSRKHLCSRLSHDHNHYAVCRNLLAPLWAGGTRGGAALLGGAPRPLAGRLEALLAECVRPKRPGGRAAAAGELRRWLADLNANYSKLAAAAGIVDVGGGGTER